MKLDSVTDLVDSKHVVIVHPYMQSEVSAPKFGGSRLIAEQIRYFEQHDLKVKVISLCEIGSITSLAYRLQAGPRLKANTELGSKRLASESTRWGANLVQVLVNELLSRIDYLFKRKVARIFESFHKDSILIYNYPYSMLPFIENAKKNDIECVLYEHNIEWKFFEEKLSNNWLYRTLTSLAKKIELRSLNEADRVFLVNSKDRSILIDTGGISDSKAVVWIPKSIGRSDTEDQPVGGSLKQALAAKFVVGFVGTDFAPNIIAVKNIIAIAKLCPEPITFLVIGSVKKSFEHKKDLPKNVIFSGFVENLEPYLSLCHAFINPKTSSDTGIETKMFDYLNFDKPIIATDIGSHGFEDSENVFVSDLNRMPLLLAEIMEKRKISAQQ